MYAIILYMSVSAEVLRSQIDYTAWANLRLLDAAAKLSPEELTRDFQTADGSVVDTLAHVFAADRIWLTRITGGLPHPFISDEDCELPALQTAWPPLMERWKTWAAALTDEQVNSQFSYADLKGNPWTQSVWQVVLHVVNHGTHHRGQIAGFVRSMGHTPPTLDLIYYYRQQ
jgi:uncharacterized damage-inducible protein DinB